MTNIDEKTILKQDNVKITNRRIIIYGKAYLVSDTTSATMVTNSSAAAKVFWNIGCLIGILIVVFSIVFSINFDLMGYSILGLILIGGAIYTNRTSKPTTYWIKVFHKNDTKSIFSSEDKILTKNIFDALNEAIANKPDTH